MLHYLFSLRQKKTVQNVGFVYVGSLINGLSLFLINVILARNLEPSWFAVFSLSTLALTTVAELSDFGLNGGLIRFVPYYKKNGEEFKLQQLLKLIWSWRVGMSILLTIGGILMAGIVADRIFGQPVLTSYLRLSFLGIGGVVLLGFIGTYLRAVEQFLFESWMQSLKGILRVVAVALLVLCGVTDVWWFLIVYSAVPWLLVVVSYKKLPPGFRSTVIEDEKKKNMNKQLLQFSFWITIGSLCSIVSSRIDQLMLSNMLGLVQVATYTTAFQFTLFYALGLQSINTVLIPKFSAMKSKKEILSYIQRLYKYLIPLVCTLCIGVFLLKFVFLFLFGAKYADALPVYVVLSFSMILQFLALPFSFIPVLFNKTIIFAMSGIIQLVINIVLNIYLIPQYGVMGAGYTFALGVIFSILFSLCASAYLFKYKKIVVV